LVGIVASILLIYVYDHVGYEVESDMVFLNLGLSGFGYITGLKLLVVSVVMLIQSPFASPFSPEDLGFIAISGFIMMLVSYRTTRRIFRKGESSAT